MAKVIKAAIIAVVVVVITVAAVIQFGPAGVLVTQGMWGAAAVTMYLTAFVGTLVAGGIGMLSSKGMGASGANFGTKVSAKAGAAPRQLIYGTTRVGGTIVKMDTRGSSGNILCMSIVVAGHECDGWDDIYFNETKLTHTNATTSGETVYTATNAKFSNSENALAFGGTSLARWTFHDGTQDAVDGLGAAGSAVRYPSSCKLLGCTYFYMEIIYDPEDMPSMPSIWFVMRGKNIWDPRANSGSGAISTTDLQRQNPALQIRDYLSNTLYGLKALDSEINDTTGGGGFQSAANTCDQDVTLADGSTLETRYTSNGFSNFSASGSGLIESITTACAGNVTYTNGKFNLFAGASQTPALTINDDNILAAPKITTQSMSGELFNSVKSIFVNKDDNYQASEVTQYNGTAFLAADTPSGEASANFARTLELKYPFTTSETMAQRLQRIGLEHQRQSTSLEVLTSLEFMKAQPNDWIYVTNSRLGYTNKIFEIQGMSMTFLENDGNVFAATSLQLQEMSTDVFGFAYNSYSTPQPNATAPDVGTLAVDPPTIGTPIQVTNVEGQTAKINIKVVWTNVVDSAIQGTEIQFKKSTDADSLYVSATLAGKSLTSGEIANVTVGIIYNIRVRHFTFDNVYSVYSSVATITIAQPDTINAISAGTITCTTDKPFNVQLEWVNPANTNLRAVEVYLGTNTTFTPAEGNLVGTYYGDVGKKKTVLIGKSQGLEYDSTDDPNSYYFKLRAINIYGSASAYSTSPIAKIKQVTSYDVDELSANKLSAGTIDADVITVENLDASEIKTGKLTLSGSTADAIRLGKTDYEDSTTGGFFLGFTATGTIEEAFYIGTASNGLHYTPSTGLVINGSINATTGDIGGIIVTSDSISSPISPNTTGAFGNSNTGFYLGSDGKFSLSDKLTFDGSAAIPLLTIEGNVVANKVTVGTGANSATMSGDVEGSNPVRRFYTGADAGPNEFYVNSDGSVHASDIYLYDSNNNLIYSSATGFEALALTQIASDSEGVKVTTYSEALANDSDEVEIVISQTSTLTVKSIKSVSAWTGVGESNTSEAAGITAAENEIVNSFDMMIRYGTTSGFSISEGTLASTATAGADNYTRYTMNTDYVKDGVLWFYDPEPPGTWRARANVRNNHLDVNANGQIILSATITDLAAGTYYFKTFMRPNDGSGYNTASIKVTSSDSRTFAITDNTTDGGFFVDGGASQTVGAADITSVNITTAANSGLTGGSNQLTGSANFTLALSADQSLTNMTLSGYLRGPATFTIDPAAHGDDTGLVVIAGNLQVDGTTTTINSTVVEIADLNFKVAKDAANASAANGAGLTVGGADAELKYVAVGDKWTMNKPLDITGNIIVSGTVDGRDVATDGTKLDTIATDANNYVLPFTNNSTNWNTAYGWGNHASAGYGVLSASQLWTGINQFNTRIELDGDGGWAYARMLNGSSILWDIAANPAENSSALQFRPSGSATNATLMSTSGNWTMGGDIDIVSHSLKISGTTVIDASRNIIGTTFNASGADTTPAGTAFENTMKSTTSRVLYLDGTGGSTSFWQGSGNTAHSAIDTNGTVQSFWSNNGAGWQQQMQIGRGYVNLLYDLQMGGTTVIDASRNLTNIGTITATGAGSTPYNFLGTSTSLVLNVGNATQTSYSSFMMTTNDGNAQLWKTGSAYSAWGGADALNIYNSNGNVSFHPQATANVLQLTSTAVNASQPIQMGGTTVIDASRNVSNVNMVKFREAGSSFYISPTNANTLNGQYDTATDAGDMWINYRGYQDGWSYFRDFRIGNGKGTCLLAVDGSAASFDFQSSSIIQMGGTTVIDASRNITAGTVASSGAVTLSVDTTDALNFSANSTTDARGISFNNRTALSADYNDGWLRLNQLSEFSNGIYTPANLRVDGVITTYGGLTIGTGVLKVGTTTVIDASRNLTNINDGYFDGGNLILGDKAYAVSGDYIGMKTAYQSGTSDYMILSGISDGHTYVSAKDGSTVHIRGGGNNSSNQLQVPDSTYMLATTSEFRVTGNVTAYYSDERLKDFHGKIDGALDKVMQLGGYYFTENAKAKELGFINDKRQIGVNAQQVQKVFPEVVGIAPISEGLEEDYLTVHYDKLVPVLIEAIKELTNKVNALETKLSEQETK